MSSPWEIRTAAKKVRGAAEDVRREAMAIRGEFGDSMHYWSGEASKAFRAEMNRLSAAMRNQQQCLDRMEDALNRLAGDVYRADEEREARRRAAERLRAEQQAALRRQR